MQKRNSSNICCCLPNEVCDSMKGTGWAVLYNKDPHIIAYQEITWIYWLTPTGVIYICIDILYKAKRAVW